MDAEKSSLKAEEKKEPDIVLWAKREADRIKEQARIYSKKFMAEEYIRELAKRILKEGEEEIDRRIEATKRLFEKSIKAILSIPQEELDKLVEEILKEVFMYGRK